MGVTKSRSATDAALVASNAVGEWAAALRWQDVPGRTQERLRLVLMDSFGVTVLGGQQGEQRRLVDAWRPAPGSAPLLGGDRSTTVEAAAWLNATAMVRLELDEGHKFAQGHPASHAFSAVLALAADLGATGADTAAGLLVAYEVAARFGRATTLRPGAHPHGSWGVPGAAAGCGRLLGLSGPQVAAAVDTAAGMPIAGHFASALDGNPVRDAWMGASNVSGLAAARLAAAGIARNTGTAATSLGDLLGAFDAAAITDGLGERWDIELGYFKRHASCSFTHPVADAVLQLRDDVRLDAVDDVLVETHSLGAGLSRRTWDSRLSAMFSTPFVVAAALVHGHVGPGASANDHRDDPRLRELAGKVTVRVAGDLDARLPDERAARVTVRAGDVVRTVEVPNPVGDAAHHPLTEEDVVALLHAWLDDEEAVATVQTVASQLVGADDVGPLLRRLM